MRYISKHGADVYLDKEEEEKKHKTEGKGPRRRLQMSRLRRAMAESIPVLAQCRGTLLHLFEFSLFLIENSGETSGRNKPKKVNHK